MPGLDPAPPPLSRVLDPLMRDNLLHYSGPGNTPHPTFANCFWRDVPPQAHPHKCHPKLLFLSRVDSFWRGVELTATHFPQISQFPQFSAIFARSPILIWCARDGEWFQKRPLAPDAACVLPLAATPAHPPPPSASCSTGAAPPLSSPRDLCPKRQSPPLRRL